MQTQHVGIPSQVLDVFDDTQDFSICKKYPSRLELKSILEPTLWAFDADGTIFETAEGDHWFSIIKQLPKEVKTRIFARAKILSQSEDIFEQQYFSASSLYEFAKLDLFLDELVKLSEKAKMRDGAVETLNALIEKGHKVIIISHGIKAIIQAILTRSGVSDKVEIIANGICTKEIYSGISTTNEYIPNHTTTPRPDTDNWNFLKFVKTMEIVPKNKGMILEKIFRESKLSNVIAIGDSNGDGEMFYTARNLGGFAILHVHVDREDRIIVKNPRFEDLFNEVEFFCNNKKDYSFKPTSDLINELVQQ